MQQADIIGQSTLVKPYHLRSHLGNLEGIEAKYPHLFEIIMHALAKFTSFEDETL